MAPDSTARARALIQAGNLVEDEGRLATALEQYENAIRIAPAFAQAHLNRGNVLFKMGQMASALAAYETVLTIDPKHAGAHYNIGNAHLRANLPMAALGAYDKALAIDSELVDAHLARANVLDDLGRFDASLLAYRRVLELRPDYLEAHSNMLFSHAYRIDFPPERMLADARRFGALAARDALRATDWSNDRDPDRHLRIGLISGDLRNHPVGYFVEGILAALRRNASSTLTLYAYPTLFHGPDAVSERIKANCHAWYPTAGFPDAQVVDKIVGDKIDILLDLSGHTVGNRLALFAWKPAPVQATWLGYWATTGLVEIDYLIADPRTLTAAQENCFTEQIWRLPETRLCFTAPSDDVLPGPLPALDNGFVTFGCFNTLSKMNDDVVEVWGRILRALPTSRLFLKASQLNDPDVREEVEQRFSRHGVTPRRLMLHGPTSRADYLAAYRKVDIALDPFPFPGGTTSAEALWMGVPVLTLSGQRFHSRQGLGILTNAGLNEWIADSADDYVARAVSRATDLEDLAALRSGLRHRVLASPLFDASRFASHFEAALRAMWQRWCRQRGA